MSKDLKIGVCSFSFHRLLAAGKQDVFQYILDCKALGCTQLDPWNAHLSPVKDGDAVLHAGKNPHRSHHLSAADTDYIDRVRAAADRAGMPFGTIAVDGAHVYEPTAEARKVNRANAYRWIDVAARLGATQVRIDAGGPEEMPEEVFEVIVEGYNDLIARAAEHGIEVLLENHWGPTKIPAKVEKLCMAVKGLGLLYDTHNWKPELRAEGQRRCARFARATHVKTFGFDARGTPIDVDVNTPVCLLQQAGYSGTWGVESVPRDGDEIAGVRKTIDLIRRLVTSPAASPASSAS
jgi:sugar phosphate isomerase/epimerase